MTIQHNCTEMGCYLDTVPDWRLIDDCFPGKISPTDIDGCVEISSHFLIMDWKASGKEVPQGQDILFKRFSRLPLVTVIVIRGEVGWPEDVIIYKNGKVEKHEADVERLRAFCTRWADAASGGL